MRISEADILIVPGYTGSSDRHWQTRWEQKLSTAHRVEQRSWDEPDPEEWSNTVARAVNAATRPVILVAHSIGVAACVHAVSKFERPVAGAFFVAPPDVSDPALEPASLRAFGPYPRDPLPFPSAVVASGNDPYSSLAAAEDAAAAWGSLFIDAGESGHLNDESGHGPWPEGLLAFGKVLARL